MVKHGRITTRLMLVAALAAGVLAATPAVASAKPLTLRDAKKVALTKVKNMQRELLGEGAHSAGIRGCWREARGTVGCLGLVAGKDDFLRWRCAVPMTIRRRATASASGRRLAVKYTPPMCSF